MRNILPDNITPEQCKDTGMAMVLLLLIAGLFTHNLTIFKIALPVLIVNMVIPRLFYPLAVLWIGISHILGTIMSKILLTLVFIILVIPVGYIRRKAGKDPLQLNKFKNGTGSVMQLRNQIFKAEDIAKPY